MTILSAVDRETIDSLTTAVGFDTDKIPPTQNRTEYAIIQAIDADVRFTLDGTTPTSSLGLRLVKDDSVEVWGDRDLRNFLCIDDGGTAKLEVAYQGRTV